MGLALSTPSFFFLIAVFSLVALPPPADASEPKFALIIANKNYSGQVGRLSNPHKDAGIIKQALMSAHFPEGNIFIVRDASRGEILAAVEDNARRLGKQGEQAIGFLYYSGHGAAKPNTDRNYLIPVNVVNAHSDALWYDAVSLDSVRDLLREHAPDAAHILVFDACRNELQTGQRGNKGFVPVANWGGMLIAYSTSPGQVASDGDPNALAGPYAMALSEELRNAQDLSVEQLFANVRLKVRSRVGWQSPWFLHGLDAKIVLGQTSNPQPGDDAAIQGLISSISDPARDWTLIKETESIATLEAFRAQYGGQNPVYDSLARERIALLKQRLLEERPGQKPAEAHAAVENGVIPAEQSFDGMWTVYRTSKNCKAKKVTHVFNVQNGIISGATKLGSKISGRISADGTVTFRHTGVDGAGRMDGIPISYKARVAGKSGNGTFYKGANCNGEFTLAQQ